MNARIEITAEGLRQGLTMADLACPGCHGPLALQDGELFCRQAGCQATPGRWPVIQGAPVLLDESRSLARIDAFRLDRVASQSPWWHRVVSKVLHARPGLSLNVAAKRNYRRLSKELESVASPLVLLIGCGDGGEGLSELLANSALRPVGLDLRWTEQVSLIADGQQLPFRAALFDAVILQGVLEHVLDHFLVEQELFRTLKAGGLIYCELPFMQPTHGGAFDFIRLTQVGHRRFWRRFEALDVGVCCGPAMALAHMVKQFLRALLPGRLGQVVADWCADWSLWWLKYLDYGLVHTPAGVDGASAFYFLGRKGQHLLTDLQVIQSYRGGQ